MSVMNQKAVADFHAVSKIHMINCVNVTKHASYVIFFSGNSFSPDVKKL